MGNGNLPGHGGGDEGAAAFLEELDGLPQRRLQPRCALPLGGQMRDDGALFFQRGDGERHIAKLLASDRPFGASGSITFASHEVVGVV